MAEIEVKEFPIPREKISRNFCRVTLKIIAVKFQRATPILFYLGPFLVNGTFENHL